MARSNQEDISKPTSSSRRSTRAAKSSHEESKPTITSKSKSRSTSRSTSNRQSTTSKLDDNDDEEEEEDDDEDEINLKPKSKSKPSKPPSKTTKSRSSTKEIDNPEPEIKSTRKRRSQSVLEETEPIKKPRSSRRTASREPESKKQASLAEEEDDDVKPIIDHSKAKSKSKTGRATSKSKKIKVIEEEEEEEEDQVEEANGDEQTLDNLTSKEIEEEEAEEGQDAANVDEDDENEEDQNEETVANPAQDNTSDKEMVQSETVNKDGEEDDENEETGENDETEVLDEDQSKKVDKMETSEDPEPASNDPSTDPPTRVATPPPPPKVVRPPPLPPMKMSLDTTTRIGEPRLVIHQIVLKNFKSYAGRQVIGPFHKSFSAIVGPNGSGKSNTIDALLFVFGFKATKMRQGKLSELIHNSSASPSGGFESCSVEVWFRNIIDQDGADDYTVVPNSALVVARTATRSNQSKYTINGKLSNFTEVTTMLKDKGIDLDHKRFLILQGEVESIAQMKPKAVTEHEEGLLEYLEDIIGTNRFREPISTAVTELESLGSLRAQKLERVKLVEREKKALEARKKLADDYLARTNLLIQRQNELWQYYVYCAKENVGTIEVSVEEHMKELEENIKKHEGDILESERLEKSLEEEEGKYKEVESETGGMVKELERKEREMVSLGEKMKHARGKQKKLKKTITDDEHALKAAIATARDSQSEVEKLRAELEAKEALIEKEEAELDHIRDSLKDKTQVFADQIEVKQAELAPWAAQVTTKKAALDLAMSERNLILKKTEDVKASLEAAQDTIKKIETESKTKADELKVLKQEQKEYLQGIRDAQEELKKVESEDSKLRSQYNSARQKADEAKTARSINSSKSQVLNSLSKLKQQGRLRGFHGRLGDLGRIDEKYDVAISTACPQLDNLVCDSVETGQSCLAHLKQTNAGRAVILCLNALSASDSKPIETPESAPRLIDLVTPKDESFRVAFYHVLRDTLVANDLTQANRIAFGGKKRWRVVTLDGKLIDSSGTMSGGGTRVSKGLMGSSIVGGGDEEYSEERIAKFEKDVVKAEEKLSNFQTSKSSIEDELNRLQGILPHVEMKITKLEMDLSGGIKRLEEAKRTIEDIRSQDNVELQDEKEIKSLEKIIDKNQKEMDSLKTKTKSIEEEIKELQEKILQVGGVKLRTQQSKVKDLKEIIEHTSNRLTKSEVTINKSKRDTEKFTKSLEKNSEELKLIEVGLEELEGKNSVMVTETEAMRDTVDQARISLEEQKDRLVDIQKKRNEKLKFMNAFEKEQTELKQLKEKAEIQLAKEKHTLEHWRKKQASLKLIAIDHYDDDEDEKEEKEEDGVLKVYDESEFEKFDVEMTKAEVAKLEEDQERAPADLGVLEEYAKREAEFMSRANDLEITTNQRDECKQLLDDLNSQRLEEFMWGFQIISGKLKEMYQMITLGGNAELELVDSLDPFSEGIIFSVMPPKKSWKNISNLSGGEKTLSSLALVFALHAFKPTPLYFMDEIDAALDFRNVSIIGNYIKDRTKNAQFIIISLRNNMFELSRRLVGIYKTKNCTKSIAVDNSELLMENSNSIDQSNQKK